MGKKRDAGNTVIYGNSAHVPAALNNFFVELQHESFLAHITGDLLAQRLAHYYGELDAIHPFREGNSRTLRQFFRDLARQNGHRLDWAAASNSPVKRTLLIAARDRAVMHADFIPLAGILAANLHAL